MLDQLFQSFTQAPQGQEAMRLLQAQGFPPGQSMEVLQSAFPAAAQAMSSAQSGREGPGLTSIGDSNYITNFLSGAVSSLVRGQGFKGAAIDGLQGVVGGHVAQVIAGRFGFPQRLAGTIGAIVVPLMIDFIWDKVKKNELSLSNLTGGGGAPAAPTGDGGGPSKLAMAGGAVAAIGAGAAIAAGAMHLRNKSKEREAEEAAQQAAAHAAAQQAAMAAAQPQQLPPQAGGYPPPGYGYPPPGAYGYPPPGYGYPPPESASKMVDMRMTARGEAHQPGYRPLPGGVAGLGGVRQAAPAYLTADLPYTGQGVGSVYKMFGGN